MNVAPIIDLLEHAWKLKDTERTGWVLRGISAPESVAAHSWGTALLCLWFATRVQESDGPVDVDRAVRIALVHDLAEAEVGDIPRRVDSAAQPVDARTKTELERTAMERFSEDAADIHALWCEYEDAATAEARFVRDMNLIDMVLQALRYERHGRYDPEGNRHAFPDFEYLDEFFATSEPRLSTNIGRTVFAEIRRRYRSVRPAGRPADHPTSHHEVP